MNAYAQLLNDTVSEVHRDHGRRGAWSIAALCAGFVIAAGVMLVYAGSAPHQGSSVLGASVSPLLRKAKLLDSQASLLALGKRPVVPYTVFSGKALPARIHLSDLGSYGNALAGHQYRSLHVEWMPRSGAERAGMRMNALPPKSQAVRQDVAVKPPEAKTVHVRQVSSEEELDRALQESPLVVLDVYTKWCGPCKLFEPIYESIAAEWSGKVTFLKMDCNANDSTEKLSKARFQTKAIPVFIFFRNGEVVSEVKGVAQTAFLDQLNALVQEH